MSYDELLALIKGASQEAETEASRPPESCTRCGRPWTKGPNGELHCTFEGNTWNGGPVTYGQ